MSVAESNESKTIAPSSPLWFGERLEFLHESLSSKIIGDDLTAKDRLLVCIGEAGTLKSRLATAFLIAGFAEKVSSKSGAVLLTSEGANRGDVSAAFKECGVGFPDNSRLIVRQVLPRFLSSSNFVFRLKLCIRHVKKQLELDLGSDGWEPAWRVRVVIDNWNAMVDSHSPLKNDPQLLQAVVSLLRAEGVLALIVGTQPGSPAAPPSDRRVHDISQIEATRLHVWPVNFFGDRRTAITTSLPGSKERRTATAELLRVCDTNGKFSDHNIEIHRSFDFYEALETGDAKRVELRVKLYSGYDEESAQQTQSSTTYSSEVSALFGDLFPSSHEGRETVSFENIARYDAFKEYIQNLESAELRETLVFQVDEFWTGKSGTDSFADLEPYFGDTSEDPSGESDDSSRVKLKESFEAPMADDYSKIPLHKDFGIILADRDAWWRARNVPLYDLFAIEAEGMKEMAIPWSDTGHLNAASVRLPYDDARKVQLKKVLNLTEVGVDRGDEHKVTVGDVWNALCLKEDRFKVKKDHFPLNETNPPIFSPSWQIFFAACEAVALESGRGRFDIDLRTKETLSSFVLEVWLSMIIDRQCFPHTSTSKQNGGAPGSPPKRELSATWEMWDLLFKKNSDTDDPSLRELAREFQVELDIAVRLIFRYLPGRYRDYDLKLEPANMNAIAMRTWFATASICQESNRNLAALALVGQGRLSRGLVSWRRPRQPFAPAGRKRHQETRFGGDEQETASRRNWTPRAEGRFNG